MASLLCWKRCRRLALDRRSQEAGHNASLASFRAPCKQTAATQIMGSRQQAFRPLYGPASTTFRQSPIEQAGSADEHFGNAFLLALRRGGAVIVCGPLRARSESKHDYRNCADRGQAGPGSRIRSCREKGDTDFSALEGLSGHGI